MKPQIVFFTELLGPSLIINLAQLVSPSVALPAELVFSVVIHIPFFLSRSVGLMLNIRQYNMNPGIAIFDQILEQETDIL